MYQNNIVMSNDDRQNMFQRKESSAGPKVKNNTGLPDSLKTGVESLSGISMDDVRVHYNSSRPAQLHALAYTQGTDIHVAPGQEKHLPHEAWHVVQQMQGRVQPTMRLEGVNINDNTLLEHEADVMGERAHQTNLTPKVLQMKKYYSHVTQRTHISVQKEADSSRALNLAKNKKPTIVFESMGVNNETKENVYKQTTKYSGNTICIFGVNKKDDPLGGVFNSLTGIADIKDTNSPHHHLKNFFFVWKKPEKVKDDEQYKMPFIEARVEIMKQAKRIVDIIPKPAETESQTDDEDLSKKFVYRWIDGDATEDTSEQVSADYLKMLSRDEINVLSGSYSWRSEQDMKKYPAYNTFLAHINKCEWELRRQYFFLNGALISPNPASRGLPDYMNSSNLNGYYLPETTLMLSPSAHETIINAFSGQREEENMQDKESMRILKSAKIAKNSVYHAPRLHVYKPLKNDFGNSRTTSHQNNTPNYLGEELLNLLKSGEDPGLEGFNNKLVKMRQSVFDKFQIPGDSDFNTYKTNLIKGLYDVYLDSRNRIKKELNPEKP